MTVLRESAGADPGLFGPDSVVWRVHSDRSMAVAGFRALLLQAVHPVAMAGVAQFSDYRTNPWGRLFRTAEFVGVTTYGTTEDALAAGKAVRAVHARLVGTYAGESFRVDDPELLRWVHVCEAESFLSTYRRAGGTLRRGDADRYYAEMTRAAELVGAAPVPATEDEVRDYYASMQDVLAVGHEARQAALFIARPPMKRWVALATPARPAWLGLGVLGFSLMPRWARSLYARPAFASSLPALPGFPTTDLAASVVARSLRTALAVVPPNWREGPAYKDAKARVGLAS
jgi:uncharacterized protein (DUF2236 family)